MNNAVSSADDVASLLLKLSYDEVARASQDLKRLLGIQERSQLAKVREELLFFSWFALDYWTSDSVFVHTQEERRTIKEALSYHWREIAGGGYEGQARLYTLQERLNAYAQIVNEIANDKKGFNANDLFDAMILNFGRKLSEFCGIGKSPLFALVVGELFTKTMDSVAIVCKSWREFVERTDT